MLTRRDFAGIASCALCAVTGFIATEASAQGTPPATTPGVTRLTTGAMLCSGAPPTSGIGAPARDKLGAPFIRAIPPDTTSADKTRFIVVSTLGVTPVHSGRTAPLIHKFQPLSI